MELVYKSSDIIEAHIISAMLKANGIEVFVGGHYLQGTVGIISGLSFANIQVSNDDCERSKELIAEYDAKGQRDVGGENSITNISSPTTRLLMKTIIFIAFVGLSILVVM
jgi:hypothetical protein